ncbi:hypothetical protein [Maribacter arenosus]|uniref:Uncharacterized protein n=1 Tax=Maribacter arenosus TaxID=1854708 RepID=A0ABR7VDI6_9FLAO|nr:hypothetical protein [Maribacter arenosus]MBD0850378.1 hypothetical protein [Maribacter arenosus]
MKKRMVLFLIGMFCLSQYIQAQNSVDIDGRLQPILTEFFEQCKKYDIDYHSKLFQLKNIDIVNNLPLEENNTVLGMVSRDEAGNIENILINWAALLDNEILKVVAFHEFAHHFLDYKHTCTDCEEIMAETNVSYFNIARDWDNQVKLLFTTSPIYMAQQKGHLVAATKAL